jgi:hypothetical protein
VGGKSKETVFGNIPASENSMLKQATKEKYRKRMGARK